MRVLFVCSGNYFRSMAAEYAARKCLEGRDDITVSSAGTKVDAGLNPSVVDDALVATVKLFGIDPSKHVPTQLNKELCSMADVIVAMDSTHKAYIEKLGYKALLYNEAVWGDEVGIYDVGESLPAGYITDWIPSYQRLAVGYIFATMPIFLQKVQKLFPS